MQLLVARVGRPHGLRGEVTVQVYTDSPGDRFVMGARFATEPASSGPLTVRDVRIHKGVTLLAFDEVPDRTAAEALRGTRLFVEIGRDEPGGQDAGDIEEGWYEGELLGLRVVTGAGETVGEVAGLETRPVQDLLVVRLTSGAEALVPFVDEIVPEVDLGARRVVIAPPAGLLELAEE